MWDFFNEKWYSFYMKILFKNASILKMDDSPIYFGELVVEDNRIKYIGEDSSEFAPFDRIIDCEGNVLMPGFKNAHTHSAMTFLRSKCDDASLHDWLFNEVFPREDKLTPEDMYHLAKGSILEYIANGITACLDQYFFPPMCGKACEELGFRVVLQGIYNPKTNPLDLMERRFDEYNSKKDSLVTYRLGSHAEYTTSDEELEAIAKGIHDKKTKYLIHLGETKSEVENCIKNRGAEPAIVLDQYGLWDFGGVAYHCCYLSQREIDLFKKKNVAIVTCPGSNLKLASGIAPIRKYLDEGLLIGIGTDGPASNNCLDMFKEMMLVSNLAKVTNGDPTSIDSYTILKMATVNGAKIMDLNDADTLEVGKLADLIMIDLSRPNMQPINDVVNNIVYAGNPSNIKLTMINGKILYEDGKFYLSQKVEDIYAKVQEITDRIDMEIANDK